MELVDAVPGTTFSNVGQRGSYDSDKAACLTLDKLERWLAVTIAKYYHLRPHEGLDGQAPLRRWQDGVAALAAEGGTIPVPRDPRAYLASGRGWKPGCGGSRRPTGRATTPSCTMPSAAPGEARATLTTWTRRHLRGWRPGPACRFERLRAMRPGAMMGRINGHIQGWLMTKEGRAALEELRASLRRMAYRGGTDTGVGDDRHVISEQEGLESIDGATGYVTS